MKNNLRRLQMMLKIFGHEDFFNCEANDYNASCIGRFKPSIMLKALANRFEISVSKNGFIHLSRGQYLIILTD